MIKRQNFKELQQSLEDYCTSSEYSHPFIIAGWPGVGKSSIVEEVKKKFPALKTKDFNLEKEIETIQIEIIDKWNHPSEGGEVICITCGVDISPLRELLQAGCCIYMLDLDSVCWLEWAKGLANDGLASNIDPMLISFIEHNPAMLHSYLSVKDNMLRKADAILEELCEDDASDFHQTFIRINNLFTLMQRLFLSQSEADPIINRLMEACFLIQNKANDDYNARLLNVVMQIGELYPKAFIEDKDDEDEEDDDDVFVPEFDDDDDVFQPEDDEE